MDYQHFSVIDFATDDDFILWVLSPDETSQAFWRQWLDEHPAQKPVVHQARRLILSIKPGDISWSDERRQIIKSRILKRIVEDPGSADKKSQGLRIWGRVAAVLGFLMLALVAWVVWKSKSAHYKTDFGITQEVRLPDGSLVILGPNSTLSYKNVLWSDIRKARLSGEAFFQIVKKENQSRFIVESGKVITEVLGTEFNIRARRDTTQVVLTSGSIRLHPEDMKTEDTSIMLSPGDLIEYDRTNVIRKEQVDTEQYAGLRHHMLILKQTPLRDVAKQVYDLYGFSMHFPKDLLDASFTAKIPMNSDGLELLESLLRESFDLRVSEKTEHSLVFRR